MPQHLVEMSEAQFERVTCSPLCGVLQHLVEVSEAQVERVLVHTHSGVVLVAALFQVAFEARGERTLVERPAPNMFVPEARGERVLQKCYCMHSHSGPSILASVPVSEPLALPVGSLEEALAVLAMVVPLALLEKRQKVGIRVAYFVLATQSDRVQGLNPLFGWQSQWMPGRH